jgi:hypothetical protein
LHVLIKHILIKNDIHSFILCLRPHLWKVVPGDDEDARAVRIAGAAAAARFAPQCRFALLDARRAAGPCAARAAAEALWRGEEFVLQIDAHMRWVDALGAFRRAPHPQGPAGRPRMAASACSCRQATGQLLTHTS